MIFAEHVKIWFVCLHLTYNLRTGYLCFREEDSAICLCFPGTDMM